MARPHIEFIQAQNLPWARGAAGPARADCDARILSRDGSTGALSAILRYPTGWHRAAPESLVADEELFVLDGELEIGGQRYGRNDYACLPAGYPRTHARATNGAVVLTFLSGPAQVATASGSHDQRKLVAHISTETRPWGGTDDVGNPGLQNSGVRTQWLRRDPDTGEESYLLAMLPWVEERTESHPVVQEMFLLSGEITGGKVGVMQPGAYFWRPEDVVHGPFGSRTGNIVFMRAMGGKLTTQFFGREKLDYRAPHRPVLPPELQPYGGQAVTGMLPY